MNIFTALEQIGWTAFYLLVFLLACSAVTSSIKQIVREIYASKTTYVKLTAGEQTLAEQEAYVKSVNERIANVLAEKQLV